MEISKQLAPGQLPLMEQVELQLSRELYPLPTMKLNPAIDSLFDFTYDDFELVDYQSHPHIKAPVAV